MRTIDELQAYKAKAKRQRDAWKRKALAYETAIRETLDENAHLADGDDCTLVKLNRVLSANAGVGQQEEGND
ncbi:MAG: hypothetical protein ABIH03_02490 [Pseudomonadota bacterium]